jgi:membrane associated rhomboid family serine protease
VPVFLTILFAMFMHGGFAHIAGNMLFLLIFGDNVEDRLGRLRFLLFYLACGVAATLAHVYASLWAGRDLLVPSLGASGAISGVLGAYLLMFPRKRVRLLMFFTIVEVPAFVAVGLWFVFQLVNGLGYLGGGTGGGVAYAAHVGGFLFGFATVKLWALGRRRLESRPR